MSRCGAALQRAALGDMARIRDTAPAICRGFVIFEGRHAKSPKGERRFALVTSAAQAAQHAS